jgi:GNAT superfamily N-acetyltransferase
MYALEIERNNEGKQLADRYLGKGYYDSIINKDCRCCVAKYEDTVAGWAVVCLTNPVPVLKSMVVDEPFRGTGVSDLLIEYRMDLLTRLGYRFVRCYAWTNTDGKCNAEKVLQRNKFYCVNVIPNYYSHLTNCPHCGDGNQCQCYAKVYCRSI